MSNSKCEESWQTAAGLRAACWWVHNSHRCGYVAVPEGHPAYGLDYDAELLREINVHGGLTYSWSGGKDAKYPGPGENLWWFGFDCAHLGDQISGREYPGDVLRSQLYVKNECEDLARQLDLLRPSGEK